MTVSDRAPFRILVDVGPNRDDAIGENLMKLPMLRALKATWPVSEIRWMQGDGAGLLAGALSDLSAGLIDGFVPGTAIGSDWSGVFKKPRHDFGGAFDLIVDTQHNPRRTFALRRIPHRRLVSAAWRFMLSDARPPADAPDPKTVSLPEKLLLLHAAAAGRWSPPDPAVPIPARYHEEARRLLPEGSRYIGFSPGAGNMVRGKCWPVERFIEAAKAETDEGREAVFMLGPQERDFAGQIRAALPGVHLPDLSMGIPLTLALAARMDAAVANCSGTGHMMAAGGAPMVSLFGPTNPAKFRPYARAARTIRAQAFGSDAMEAIPVEAVTAAIRELATAQPSPSGGPAGASGAA